MKRGNSDTFFLILIFFFYLLTALNIQCCLYLPVHNRTDHSPTLCCLHKPLAHMCEICQCTRKCTWLPRAATFLVALTIDSVDDASSNKPGHCDVRACTESEKSLAIRCRSDLQLYSCTSGVHHYEHQMCITNRKNAAHSIRCSHKPKRCHLPRAICFSGARKT
jgi:hypothetical protein